MTRLIFLCSICLTFSIAANAFSVGDTVYVAGAWPDRFSKGVVSRIVNGVTGSVTVVETLSNPSKTIEIPSGSYSYAIHERIPSPCVKLFNWLEYNEDIYFCEGSEVLISGITSRITSFWAGNGTSTDLDRDTVFEYAQPNGTLGALTAYFSSVFLKLNIMPNDSNPVKQKLCGFIKDGYIAAALRPIDHHSNTEYCEGDRLTYPVDSIVTGIFSNPINHSYQTLIQVTLPNGERAYPIQLFK